MPKYFPSLTHTMVRTVKDMKHMDSMMGVIAHVDLCFGDDAIAIRYISIKSMKGITGFTAHIPKTPIIIDTKLAYLPVIENKLADEVKVAALIAFDRVKQQFGLKFNKTYRVNAKAVEEIGSVDSKEPVEQLTS